MTVKQLIEQLQSLPQDKKVFTYCGLVESVREVKDYPLGDCANPNCEYEDVIMLE